jgi:hypothetical protein
MNIKKITLLLAAGAFLVSCGDDEVKMPPFRYSQNLDMDNIKNIMTIRESSTAHSGRNVCHVDSGSNYGIIYTYPVPDSIVGKQLALDVDAWVRTGNVENNCEIVCSVACGDSVTYWGAIQTNEYIKTPNEWTNISKTIVIPKNSTSKPNSSISIITLNRAAKSYLEIDDLKINYYEVE